MPEDPKSVNSHILLDANLAAGEYTRRKLSRFVKEFWDIIINDPLEWSPHMDVLCDEIQTVYERVFLRQEKVHDLIINIPPGTSKSTIVTIMAPVWSWTHHDWIRHITGSYSDSLSTEHSVKARDIIRSDKFRSFYPRVQIKKDEDNKTNYRTTNNGQRFTTSVGGTVTGVHGHIITIDDPLNPLEAASVADLKTANDFFDMTLSTRMVNKLTTVTILLMQRLATNDPSGHLLEQDKTGYRHICLPATLSKHVKPKEYRSIYVDGMLDPVRLGPKAMAKLKIKLGSYGYSGQMDQVPVPEGGHVWQKWFIEIPDDQMPLPKWGSSYGTDWDLAYTNEEENAASAYVTSFMYKNKIYIDQLDWQWLEFPELIKWMKMQIAPHYIEAKASGKSAKQTLSGQGIIAVEVEVKGGKDKVARARSATPTAEAGMVCIRKSLADRLYNDSKQGILFFPKGQFKDVADALAQCITRHKTTGVRVLSNEIEETDEDYDPLDELDV